MTSFLLVAVSIAAGIAMVWGFGRVSNQNALRRAKKRMQAHLLELRLFGDDLVYIHSSAVVDNKASYTESMRSGNVKYRVMRRSDTKVRTYGCIAIISGSADFDVTVKGQDMAVPLRFHSIWAKRAGALQFISWQATRVPPKQ